MRRNKSLGSTFKQNRTPLFNQSGFNSNADLNKTKRFQPNTAKKPSYSRYLESSSGADSLSLSKKKQPKKDN